MLFYHDLSDQHPLMPLDQNEMHKISNYKVNELKNLIDSFNIIGNDCATKLYIINGVYVF